MVQVALLDSHTFIWAIRAPELLSVPAEQIIKNSETQILVSAASIWELAIKYHLGKFPEAQDAVEDFYNVLARYGFSPLDITPLHALAAAKLAHPHKDPFDRMLVAQAKLEGAVLVSADAVLKTFPDVEVVW